MDQNKREIKGEITDIEKERGIAVSIWIDDGLRDKRWSDSDLARATGLSNSYIGVLRKKKGVNASGIYKRPSERVLKLIADALGIEENKGRAAAGYAELLILKNSSTAEKPPEPTLHHYNLGEFNGEPIELILTKPLSDDDVERAKFAMEPILLKQNRPLGK